MSTNLRSVELVVRTNDESATEDEFSPVSLTEPLPVRPVLNRTFGYMAGNSAVHTAYTLTVPAANRARQLIYALVKYSAAPTQAGTTNVLTPLAGSVYATTLSTGTANAQSNAYVPGAPLFILPGDKFAVTAPDGGAGITAYITVAWEWIEP